MKIYRLYWVTDDGMIPSSLSMHDKDALSKVAKQLLQQGEVDIDAFIIGFKVLCEQ
jgi:hypothetical protein